METELVHNVVDLLGGSLATIVLISFLSGGVGALELEVVVPFGDLLDVALPENLVDYLEIEVVGDKLIVGEDIL